MEMREVLAIIENQQKETKEGAAPWCVGQQLKDIVRTADPAAVDLIGTDLKQKGMGIVDCEKKIAKFARDHRSGNTGFCGPQDAERIILDFYGVRPDLVDATATVVRPAKRKLINIADFM